MPDVAKRALEFKTFVKEWGIKPWELNKLTVRDVQQIRLAEHTEQYIKSEQQARMDSRSDLSANYDMNKSRNEAFG